MTQTIEQLQARVRELEEENARMKAPAAIAPIPPELAAQLERTDWTPEEALLFYADQKNYDIAGSHVRMIDTGAIASNALKHLSVARLEMKGDAELFELREQLAAAQSRVAELEAELKTAQKFADSENETLLQQLETSGTTAVQQYKDSVMKLAGEPVAARRKVAVWLGGDEYKTEWHVTQEHTPGTEPLFTSDQLIAATARLEAEVERLRDSLQTYIDEHEECQDADDWMAMMCSMEAHHVADEALAHSSDTSALDAYVAEKVKEYQKHNGILGREVKDLTRQRDLAVEALESCVRDDDGCIALAIRTLDTIKESEK